MILSPEISKINNRKLKSEIFLGVRLHTEFQHIATLINRLFCSGALHARESPLPLLAWDAPALLLLGGVGVGGSLMRWLLSDGAGGGVTVHLSR